METSTYLFTLSKRSNFRQKGLLLTLLILLVSATLSFGQTIVTKTFNSNTTWTVPPGVSQITICAIGGGGGGGGAASAYTYSGGGAGGNYAIKSNYAVTTGQTFTVTVGAGGAGGNGTNGTAGGNSTVNSTLVIAYGGGGGGSVGGTGFPGATGTPSTGSYLGGAGSPPTAGSYSGPGGGAAGAMGAGSGGGYSIYTGVGGGNDYGYQDRPGLGGQGAAGTTGTIGGGNGANGVYSATYTNGTAGTIPGGGGSGGYNVSGGGTTVGGAGANGEVSISYVEPAYTWTGNSFTTDWTDPGNWTGGDGVHYPGQTNNYDKAVVNAVGPGGVLPLISSGGTITIGSLTVDASDAGGETVTLGPGAYLALWGSGTTALQLTNGGALSVDPTSTIEYGEGADGGYQTCSSTQQTINTTITYGNLVLSEASYPTNPDVACKQVNGALNVAGNLTINSGVSCHLNGVTATVSGNVTVNGVFAGTNGVLVMNGSGGTLTGAANLSLTTRLIIAGTPTYIGSSMTAGSGLIVNPSSTLSINNGVTLSVLDSSYEIYSGGFYYEYFDSAGFRNYGTVQSTSGNGGTLEFNHGQDQYSPITINLPSGAAPAGSGTFNSTYGNQISIASTGEQTGAGQESYTTIESGVTSLTIYNLQIGIGFNYDQNQFLIPSGSTLIVNGGLLNNSNPGITGAGTLQLNGTVSIPSGTGSGGTFGPVTSLVVGNGSTSNVVTVTSPMSFENVTLNSTATPAALTLTGGNISLYSVLTFTKGMLVTGSDSVTIQAGGSVSGASTSTGWINGNQQNGLATGNNTYNFAVGDASEYTPASIAINSVTGSLYINGNIASTDANDAGNTGINPSEKSNRYWFLTKTGSGTFTNYSASFDVTNTSPGGTVANYVVRKYDSPFWNATTSSVVGDVVTASGLTNFSDFAIGQTNCTGGTSYVSTSACYTYTWPVNGQTYTTSGTYSRLIPGAGAGGCDSTVVLTLTINGTTTSSNTVGACNSYVWNGTTYTTSGTYTFSTTNSNGCDSIATLVLYVDPTASTTYNYDACGSYVWNGHTYTTSGTYTYDAGLNHLGCDSVATLVLSVYGANTTYNVTVCNASNYTFQDSVWTGYYYGYGYYYYYLTTTPVVYSASGTYTNSYYYNGSTAGYYGYLGYEYGCQNTQTLNLTIATPSTSTTTVTACDSYVWNGSTYTATGIYVDHFTNASGCDSAATLNVTIGHTHSSVTVAACDHYVWGCNGTTYYASGTYTCDAGPSLSNPSCDSIATLVLTINSSLTSTVPAVTACNSYVWNGSTYTTSGDKTYHTYSANGCDSVATLPLTINYDTPSSTSATSCDSYVWNGSTYSSTGTYTYNTTTVAGCDSLATLHLTITHSTASSSSYTTCDSYVWHGSTFTSSGAYVYHTTNAMGCDSAVTLNLTLNFSTPSTTNATACVSYVWNGATYTSSGTYTFNTTTVKGCDSLATLILTINPSTTSTTNVTACEPIGLQLFTTPGSASWTAPAGVTSVKAEVWGGGGAGGGAQGAGGVGGGGGGGGYAVDTAVAVTPGVSYAIVVGAGGTGAIASSGGTAASGGRSSFIGDYQYYSSYQVITNGGSGGGDGFAGSRGPVGVGSGYSTPSGYNGGSGQSGTVGSISGGGGGGAGSTGNGGDASSVSLGTGGTGTAVGGGNGANGVTLNHAGANGSVLGGGGGGAASSSANFAGGNGANGQVKLTWVVPGVTNYPTNGPLAYAWNGTSYTSSGTYTYHTTNVNGCDSAAVLNLTLNSTTSTQTVDTCGSYVWKGNTYTTSGNYYYHTTNAAGCDSTAILSLTTGPCVSTLNLTVFVQGYMVPSGGGVMQPVLQNQYASGDATVTDTLLIGLVDSTMMSNTEDKNASTVAYSQGVLHTNGTLTATFPGSVVGHNYYVRVIGGRTTAVETWSAYTLAIGSTTTYDFSSSQCQAYGCNQIVTEGKWSIFSADINQDENVDIYDYPQLESDIYNGEYGYYRSQTPGNNGTVINTDINGDGSVDIYDYPVYELDLYLGVYSVHP